MRYYSTTKINEILIHTTTQVHLENTMLSERSGSQNATHCRSSFYKNIRNRQITETESRSGGCQRLDEGNGECLFRYEMSIRVDGKFWNSDDVVA